MTTIGIFTLDGKPNKASLCFHLGSMFAELGVPTLLVDSDPQAELTRACLDEDRLEAMWNTGAAPTPDTISDKLFLIPGNPGQHPFEDSGGLRHAMLAASEKTGANMILVDVAPDLGATTRATLLACDVVLMPLGEGIRSVLALRALGPTLRRWRQESSDHSATPIGYVLQPELAFRRAGADAIVPRTFCQYVLAEKIPTDLHPEQDPYCLAILRPFPSLSRLAEEARKPMFRLRPSDGATGAQQQLVVDCHQGYRLLAERILSHPALRNAPQDQSVIPAEEVHDGVRMR